MPQTNGLTADTAITETNTSKAVYSSTSPRYHYMDNLRALAMMLGVVMHAALAYALLMDEIWLVSDPAKSAVMDHLMTFTHLFRMPLFFVISGFFLHYLIQSRGIKQTLKNRSLRLLLPFIIFLPLIMVSVIIVIGYAINTLQIESPMLSFIAATMENPDAPQPPISTMHLWFLFNLFLFVLLAASWVKLNLFNLSTLALFNSPKLLLTLFPLLLVPALYSMPAPLPAPERIYPELWSFGFYGIFFLFGWALFANQKLLNKLQSYWLYMIIVSLVAYPAFLTQVPNEIKLDQMLVMITEGFTPTTDHLLAALLQAYLGVHLTFLLLI